MFATYENPYQWLNSELLLLLLPHNEIMREEQSSIEEIPFMKGGLSRAKSKDSPMKNFHIVENLFMFVYIYYENFVVLSY